MAGEGDSLSRSERGTLGVPPSLFNLKAGKGGSLSRPDQKHRDSTLSPYGDLPDLLRQGRAKPTFSTKETILARPGNFRDTPAGFRFQNTVYHDAMIECYP
jgi:hypothetical protein